jgi:transcriptional regulator with XRE-family HTH domain
MANNKDDLAKKLGNNIKIFRKKLKLTQLELSIQADIAEDYLQSIEVGRRKPSLDVLEKIAKALKIELYELFK